MISQARKLTSGELAILREVRLFWGPQNLRTDEFFADSGDAALFVKTRDGTTSMMVDLTNLAQWASDGTFSRRELRQVVMGPVAQGRSPFRVTALFWLARVRALFLGWNRREWSGT